MKDSIDAIKSPVLWKDNIWDRLLDSLDDRAVIPIVGPDLLAIEVDGVAIRVEDYIARKLAAQSGISASELPDDRMLNFVVCELLRAHKDRYAICDDIFQIMKSSELQPSLSLQKLAEISAFNLFVTTSFAPVLEQAVQKMRFGGKADVASISYSRKRVEDIPTTVERLKRPTIYYLMGKLSATGNYVLSDEDLLEHICDLQTPSRRPEKIFDELKKNHLLILGGGYGDWLTRVFLRITKGERLSGMRESLEILADNTSHCDQGLVTFLEHFSSHTRVFQSGGAAEFVDELYVRWKERHPEGSEIGVANNAGPVSHGGVFISYSREDKNYAQELRAGLEAVGIKVWLDQDSLRSGDSFHPQIEHCITRECSCFVPVISQTTEARHEGYFRREWNLAIDRDRGIHHNRRFILPVIVDDTREPTAVPTRFAELNYTWLPAGVVTPVFVRDVNDVIQHTA